jgi:RNA polymerase sigma factor (sigma-70 family)
VLTRIFGPGHLELAEDVVQDTLLDALTVWQYKGIPHNATGWLYTVARNKALNIINREKNKQRFTTEAANLLQSNWTAQPALDHFFSDQEIADDQLRMMFTCCHRAISPDSQVALILKTLCGFSIPEIARAFLTTEENIHKRLVRARQKIRENNIPFEVPHGAHLEKRSAAVLEAIYLLFNEGYSASAGAALVRYALCEEAIRLAELMATHPAVANKADVYALLALMLYNASRFYARQDAAGNILSMAEQDRSRWNSSLMQKATAFFEKTADYQQVSVYHILAAISAYHCAAPDFAATNWPGILTMYDALLQIDRSPVVLLNRAIALSKVQGAAAALAELEKIKNDPALQTYYLLYATMAELYRDTGRVAEAEQYLQQAIELAPLKAEKDLLHRKLAACRKK